jgi:hypothetical protein
MLRRLFSSESEAARRLADDIELLHDSPLVDPVWYRETYADRRDTARAQPPANVAWTNNTGRSDARYCVGSW